MMQLYSTMSKYGEAFAAATQRLNDMSLKYLEKKKSEILELT